MAGFLLAAFAFSWTLYLSAPPRGGPAAELTRTAASFGPSTVLLPKRERVTTNRVHSLGDAVGADLWGHLGAKHAR